MERVPRFHVFDLTKKKRSRTAHVACLKKLFDTKVNPTISKNVIEPEEQDAELSKLNEYRRVF